MKLTSKDLRALKPGQKLWYHDDRLGPKEPKEAILKTWNHPTRFLVHVVEGKQVLEHFPWSVTTNAPVGQSRMGVNLKQWLSKRD